MKQKRKKQKIFKYFLLIILSVLLYIGLKSCAEDMEKIEKENAYEFISKCENPYAFWQGVDGESCDDARKTYYDYTDEEWKEAKRTLMEFGDITQEDYLYYEIKEEIRKEGKKY